MTAPPIDVAANIDSIVQSIHSAEKNAGRPQGTVSLVAVSKRHSVDSIRAAYAAGLRAFAENSVQEALQKMQVLHDLAIEWHFIGRIQSNKTRDIATHFDWVHSVERLSVAERLSTQRSADRGPLNICIQVNVAGEASKAGVPPEDAESLIMATSSLPHLKVRGLMCLPPVQTVFELQRKPFRQLRLLQEKLNQRGVCLDTLSMGMSNDFEAAITEGATMIRVGSQLFGARPADLAKKDGKA